MKPIFSLGNTQVIRVTGEQRHDFLNRITTNDLQNPSSNSVVPTLLTTEKGRVVDLIWYLEWGHESWLVPSPGMSAEIYQRLDQFLFPMDKAGLALDADSYHLIITMEDAGFSETGMWKETAAGITWPVEEWFGGCGLMLSRDGELDATGIQQHQFLAEDEFHQLRLERGVPLTGSEMNGQYHVQELGLLWAVNFSKGCYPGQEVVARIFNYEKNQRRRALVSWTEFVAPELPAKIVCGAESAGIITSIARTKGGFLGFGLLREKVVTGGCKLSLEFDGRLVPVTHEFFPPSQPKGLKKKAAL
ncbi:MAG: hypothetical protein K9N34_06910 [Candidatus Marinimicrobia bacterium]|nr:hypothetical protein [Candidatus Neomarinimicrobiota bacterium]